MKLWVLLRYLERETDEEHSVTMEQIINHLEKEGVAAERKSVYDDIRTLEEMGYEIGRHRRKGYSLLSRPFELPELKLLVDAVSASRFVTEKKSRRLIGKLSELTSRHQAAALRREVYVAGRVKTDNESVYYSVDALQEAILKGCRVSFLYRKRRCDGGVEYRRGGEPYTVSPYHMLWSDENYYLVAFVKGEVRHYRVDRMEYVTVLPEACEGAEEMATFRIGDYAEAVFGMFGGQPQAIALRCDGGSGWLPDVLFDRFGADAHIVPQEDGSFTAHIHAVPSEQFFGWLTGLGSAVRLVSPAETAAQYVAYLRSILQEYFTEN